MQHKSIVTVLLASLSLIRALPTQAQSQPEKFNGGLEAQIVSVGRDKTFHRLTVSITLMNKGKNTIYVLLLPYDSPPKAVDNTGAAFAWPSASGVPSCLAHDSQCIGVPNIIQYYTPPLQSWMELDPDTSPATLNFQLSDNDESHGLLASFSCVFAYRVVRDPRRDDMLTERQKREGHSTDECEFSADTS
jgi:hypothetical protein